MRIYVYDAANPANPWKVYDSTAPPFVQTLSELVRGFRYWIYYEQPVVVVAGDVNGDVRADFIVGAWQAAPGGRADAGSAYVYSGADGSLLYQKDGAAAGDFFGYSVSMAGDVNGDGKADFIVGARVADPGGRADAGNAYVYSGADGSLLYQKDGGATGDTFGWSVSAAGDVNGDGMADFIVGATRADPGGRADAGSVYVYSGADGSLLYQRDGGAEYNNFGHSVSAAGYVNGDGKADFIVGERLADPGGRLGAGSAYVYSGTDGALLYQRDGGAVDDNFGTSVSTAGDVNGDGKADFIVGAYHADPGGTNLAGSAYIYSGADGSILYQKDGGLPGVIFGYSVATAGDVNGDGKADFIVGEYGADPGGRGGAGSVYVYSGADGSILYQKDGVAANDRLGVSVSTAGDVNGDGKADFIVGAFWANPGGRADAGSAYVYSGADGSILYQKDGEAVGDQFGISVGGAN